MKRIPAIFLAIATVFTIFLMISMIASSPETFAAKKKDQNCLNRCASDNKVCFQKAKKNSYKDQITAQNECLRLKNTCIGLCPDAGL